MIPRKFIGCLLVAVAAMSVSLPGHAAMVGTAQLQAGAAAFAPGAIDSQRDWIRDQLLTAGVSKAAATARVAAMTDAQVGEVFERIEDAPAGAGTGEVILVAIIVLLVLELTGYTDIFPD